MCGNPQKKYSKMIIAREKYLRPFALAHHLLRCTYYTVILSFFLLLELGNSRIFGKQRESAASHCCIFA